ncbi:hypothetical protein pipiens_009820 [Culex pipiens pipiens]|uniref:Uncharacterized protein n=1 Tax=Culex pipiens pipiens TaxID=38569 RepID=A0ABD1DCF9_CULPP
MSTLTTIVSAQEPGGQRLGKICGECCSTIVFCTGENAITFPTIERGTLAIDHHGNTAGAMLLALRLDASPRNHRRVTPGSHSWPSE